MQSCVLTPPLRRPGEQSRHQSAPTNTQSKQNRPRRTVRTKARAELSRGERDGYFYASQVATFLLGIQDSRFTSAPLVWDTKGWVMADGTGQSIGDICAELCPVVYINVASKVQAGILDNDRYIM